MISTDDLTRIKKELPRGALKNIQRKSGVTYMTVFAFFKGKSQNVKILEAVTAEYSEYLQKVQNLKECAKS